MTLLLNTCSVSGNVHMTSLCVVSVEMCNVYCGVYGVATVSRIDEIYVSFAEYHLFDMALLQKRGIV